MATATRAHQMSAGALEEHKGLPAVIVATLFLLLGLLSSLNDVLQPRLQSSFEMNRPQFLAVQLGFFLTCFVLALPVAGLIERIGYQRAMLVGMFAMGVGALVFVIAASFISYRLLLVALSVTAAGVTVLQVSANSYMTVVGRPEAASSRLCLAHGLGSVGNAIGLKLGGLMILSAVPLSKMELRSMSHEALHYYRAAQAGSVRIPYLLLCVLAIAVAAAIGSSRLPDIGSRHRSISVISDKLRNHPNLILACIGIFACIGVELSMRSTMIDHLSQRIGHAGPRPIGGLAPLCMLGLIVGGFVGAGLLRKIRTETLLAVSACGSAGLVCILMWTNSGHIGTWIFLAVGVFHAVMFPCIFILGLAGLGALTSRGSGMMIMASVGGAAVIPFIVRTLIDRGGAFPAWLLPLVCYVYILYFALKGFRLASKLRVPRIHLLNR